MILDTSFVIDLLKGRQNAVSKMTYLAKENIPHAITTLTIFELWSGLISLEKSDKEKLKTISLIKEQVVYSLSQRGAEEAGKIDGALIKKGLTINPVDVLIAGIAISNDKKVLTSDPHFERIDGLKVEKY